MGIVSPTTDQNTALTMGIVSMGIVSPDNRPEYSNDNGHCVNRQQTRIQQCQWALCHQTTDQNTAMTMGIVSMGIVSVTMGIVSPDQIPEYSNDNGHCVDGHCVRDNGHCVSDNRHCVSDDGHCVSDNGHCVSDNGHCVSDNGHCVSDNGHCVIKRDQNTAVTMGIVSEYSSDDGDCVRIQQ
ncbi:hypothetical protein ACOMHN_019072 [Nucella lapillus]